MSKSYPWNSFPASSKESPPAPSPHDKMCPVIQSWTVTLQAPLFTGFSRQEYWSELPFPPPRDLPNPGIEL